MRGHALHFKVVSKSKGVLKLLFIQGKKSFLMGSVLSQIDTPFSEASQTSFHFVVYKLSLKLIGFSGCLPSRPLPSETIDYGLR